MSPRTESSSASDAVGAGREQVALTPREREILGLLAEGMSGAAIAEKLVLSPETVRTHVRNARSKLGASTRSQAVALALRQNAIAGAGTTSPRQGAARSEPSTDRTARALAGLLGELESLHDIERAAVYVAEEGGLALRRVGEFGAGSNRLPESLALGEGPVGKAALERRVQIGPGDGGPGGLIAAAIVGRSKLLGVLAVEARLSRPVGRSELLLLRAFATRVGEVLADGEDLQRRLQRAADQFRASWSAAGRGG